MSASSNLGLLGSIFSIGDTYYHYCSTEAFLSVVTSGELRAFDLRSMNDPREINEGNLEVKKFLEGLEFSEGSHTEKFHDDLNDIYKTLVERVRYFTISFTKKKDDLYSWLNYANRGDGFCIGFNKAQFPTRYFHDVVYTQTQFHAKLKDIWDKGLEKHSGSGNDEQKRNAIFETALSLFLRTGAYKHISWSGEDESRLIVPVILQNKGDDPEYKNPNFPVKLSDSGVEFMATPRGIRPFLSICIKETEIEEISEEKEVEAIMDPKANEDELKDRKKFLELSTVIIGPKNQTSLEVVSALLFARKRRHASVEKSECAFD